MSGSLLSLPSKTVRVFWGFPRAPWLCFAWSTSSPGQTSSTHSWRTQCWRRPAGSASNDLQTYERPIAISCFSFHCVHLICSISLGGAALSMELSTIRQCSSLGRGTWHPIPRLRLNHTLSGTVTYANRLQTRSDLWRIKVRLKSP